jgi:hypothetical protein
MRGVFRVVVLCAAFASCGLAAAAESQVQSRFGIFAGAGTVPGSSLLDGSSSATSTTNAQDPTRHPYQHRIFLDQNTCKAGAQCVLFFPSIDAGRMLIRHVSCWASVPSGTVVQAIYLSNMIGQSKDRAMQRNYLAFSTAGDDGSNAYLVVNADTYLLVEQGRQPTMTFFLTAAAAVDCTISGYY